MADEGLSPEELARLPDVLPMDMWHDGWNGAASCETRDSTIYEPYPHEWDRTLRWCSVRLWGKIKLQGGEPEFGPFDMHPDVIPDWIYRRAIRVYY